MSLDLNDPHVTAGALIHGVRPDERGDFVVDLMLNDQPDSVTLPKEQVSWTYLRRLRRWCRNNTPVTVYFDRETGAFATDCDDEFDRVDELLAAANMASDGLQMVISGAGKVAGAAIGWAVADSLASARRRFLNRCLR